MPEQKIVRRGRPTKLTHATRAHLVALIVSGVPTSSAAKQAGVSRCSIAAWRRRAFSSRPEDAAYVEFERSRTRGLIAAAEVGQASAHASRRSTSMLHEFDVEFAGWKPPSLREVLRDVDDGRT